MSLPTGFDISALVTNIVDLATPFVAVAVLIATFKIIMKVLKRG